MKTRIFGSILAVVAVALAWDWWQQGTPHTFAGVLDAPALAPALPDEVAALIDAEKPYTVVHAWATWCPPCMAEMPSLLHEAKAGRDNVALVMLSADTSTTVLQRFYDQSGIDPADTVSSTWLHDPAQSLIEKLDTERVMLPLTVAYARNGRVVQVIRTRVMWTGFLDSLEKTVR